MANAVEHAPVKGNVQVRALLFPDRLEVQVEGPGEFRAPPDGRNERSGRGLGFPLMAKLADDLALCSGPEGSTLVCLTFHRSGHHLPVLAER
jgi:anti-sigma regulatory factor (Ser/Thr protein kinase)